MIETCSSVTKRTLIKQWELVCVKSDCDNNIKSLREESLSTSKNYDVTNTPSFFPISTDTNVSEKHIVSIFSPEDADSKPTSQKRWQAYLPTSSRDDTTQKSNIVFFTNVRTSNLIFPCTPTIFTTETFVGWLVCRFRGASASKAICAYL
jgi:hypothetical protein